MRSTSHTHQLFRRTAIALVAASGFNELALAQNNDQAKASAANEETESRRYRIVAAKKV